MFYIWEHRMFCTKETMEIFLKLIELFVKFDTVLVILLCRIMKKETEVHYTSKMI